MVMIVGMMLIFPRIGKPVLYFVLLGSWSRFVVAVIYSMQHSCIPVVVVLCIWILFPTLHMFVQYYIALDVS
jgi:hypothetical protein